ncbi:hypothetical protein L484_003280 [Morus notabilis]|uniref:Rx N-terminal domain-containing protein n=1 Tax=Morus notabilis TaxID=981085 RepID=W9S494_9ROSA|nr:hypothetical protein L484_004968 [Morus notabilis]EXC08901.1 hypothetical protein L484_003280 [Morus notabilis]
MAETLLFSVADYVSAMLESLADQVFFSARAKDKEATERLDEIAADIAKFHLSEIVADRVVVHVRKEMAHSFVISSDVIGDTEIERKVCGY